MKTAISTVDRVWWTWVMKRVPKKPHYALDTFMGCKRNRIIGAFVLEDFIGRSFKMRNCFANYKKFRSVFHIGECKCKSWASWWTAGQRLVSGAQKGWKVRPFTAEMQVGLVHGCWWGGREWARRVRREGRLTDRPYGERLSPTGEVLLRSALTNAVGGDAGKVNSTKPFQGLPILSHILAWALAELDRTTVWILLSEF